MMYSKVYRRLALFLASLMYLQNSQSAPALSPQFTAMLKGITVSSTAGATTLTIETARPYEIAVDVMRVQYGANICYEDPLYTYPDDLKDRLLRGRPPLVIPASAGLSLTYSSDDVGVVVTQLVQTRSVPDRGAHFHVVKSGSVYMVVPVDVRDSTGARNASESPLDVRITMPPKSGRGLELLGTLLDLISDASKQQVVYMEGLGPDRPDSPIYQLSAQDEPARSVLLRALALMEPQVGATAWDLLFDPQSGKYFMSFISVTGTFPTTTPVPSNSGTEPGSNSVLVPIKPH